MGVQVPTQLRQDVVRVLVRHQAEVHLRHRPRRQHRLRPLALVPRRQPVDRRRGLEQVPRDVIDACHALQRLLDPEALQRLGVLLRHRLDRRALLRRRRPHVIVEPVDPDPLVRRLDRRERPH